MTRSSMWALVLTSHFWSVVVYRHACATRPSTLGHSSRTGTKSRTSLTWYRYRMWSDFIPVRQTEWIRTRMARTGTNFVPVSCKRIQSYKWAPGWTLTGTKLVPVSCKHPLRCFLINASKIGITPTELKNPLLNGIDLTRQKQLDAWYILTEMERIVVFAVQKVRFYEALVQYLLQIRTEDFCVGYPANTYMVP